MSLQLILGPLRHGAGDPTIVFAADGVWRATHTPHGPGTIHLHPAGLVEVWGPGGDWLRTRAPGMTGALDSLDGFDPTLHPVVARLAHRLPGLRLCRTERVFDALVPAILEQKVTGVEAKRAWHGLVRLVGDPAPGPVPLTLTPTPERVLEVGSHQFHALGVERRRAETIQRCAVVAHRLEEAVASGPDVLDQRLRSIAGVGAWTSAEVRLAALGDPDAVSVGDYHLSNSVSYALAGEPRGDDERMLELLAPFAGHRGRVTRLIEASGLRAPRRGPRMRLRRIARH